MNAVTNVEDQSPAPASVLVEATNQFCKPLDQIDALFETINTLSWDSGRLRTAVITIQNHSDYPLKYLCLNNEQGIFVVSPEKTFGNHVDENKFIPKKYCGGIVHTDGGGNPVIGGVSFMVEVPGMRYIICLSWFISAGQTNRVGGELRPEQGGRDIGFRVLGNGYTSTPVVVSCSDAANYSHCRSDLRTRIELITERSFKVKCSFDNQSNGCFDFAVYNSESNE